LLQRRLILLFSGQILLLLGISQNLVQFLDR
jgi:hypothetical protein